MASNSATHRKMCIDFFGRNKLTKNKMSYERRRDGFEIDVCSQIQQKHEVVFQKFEVHIQTHQNDSLSISWNLQKHYFNVVSFDEQNYCT